MLVDCKHGCVTILNISVWYYPNLCDFTKYTIAVYALLHLVYAQLTENTVCFFYYKHVRTTAKTHQLQSVKFKDATSLDDVRVAVVDMYGQL